MFKAKWPVFLQCLMRSNLSRFAVRPLALDPIVLILSSTLNAFLKWIELVLVGCLILYFGVSLVAHRNS